MKKMYILLATIMIFALLAGCAQPTQAPEPTKAEAEAPEAPEEPAEEPAEAPAEEPAEAPAEADMSDRIYFEVHALTSLPYFIDHRLGLEYAGHALGADTKYVGPVDYDMNAMINTMEQAVAEGPDGINIVGFDPALMPSINAAVEQGIPVVTLDAEVYGSDRLTFLTMLNSSPLLHRPSESLGRELSTRTSARTRIICSAVCGLCSPRTFLSPPMLRKRTPNGVPNLSNSSRRCTFSPWTLTFPVSPRTPAKPALFT